MLDNDAQIARLVREGDALAAAAQAGPLDARVPWCPDWDVAALVGHIGDVHRWAGTVVRDRMENRLSKDFEAPADADALLAWYREGHAALVDALRSTPRDAWFWRWGPAPDALSFWARRQANETAIHRCDAESARGAITPLPADEAVDGIDEWLWLSALRCKAPSGAGRTVHIHATDARGEWLVRLDEHIGVTTGHAKGDCAVRGAASDLFLWTLNRSDRRGLEVFGDAALLDVWANEVRF